MTSQYGSLSQVSALPTLTARTVVDHRVAAGGGRIRVQMLEERAGEIASTTKGGSWCYQGSAHYH